MNLLAINGSPRKGKATDTLIDKAIEGVSSESPNCNIKKLHLIDHDIQFYPTAGSLLAFCPVITAS